MDFNRTASVGPATATLLPQNGRVREDGWGVAGTTPFLCAGVPRKRSAWGCPLPSLLPYSMRLNGAAPTRGQHEKRGCRSGTPPCARGMGCARAGCKLWRGEPGRWRVEAKKRGALLHPACIPCLEKKVHSLCKLN